MALRRNLQRKTPSKWIWLHFTSIVMRDFLSRLSPLFQKESPIVILKVKGDIWTRPELIAEVNYRGLITPGELRPASFKGPEPV
jgi:bifunctional non-homologous end joining protein LigD